MLPDCTVIDKFRDRIIITMVGGKSTVVTFRSTAEIFSINFMNLQNRMS